MIKVKVLAMFIVMLMGMMVMAQNGRPLNPLVKQLTEQKDQQILAEKLNKLENSSKEDDLKVLADYYAVIGNKSKSTETIKLSLTRFPNGKAAFDAGLDLIYNEKNPAENEKHYKDYISRFGNNPQFAGNKFFDFAAYYVAVTFIGKNNPNKVREYLRLIKDTTYKTNAYSYAAREANGAGDYVLAHELIQKSFDDLERRRAGKTLQYYTFAQMYADILFHEKKYDRSYVYANEVYWNSDKKNKEINTIYLNTLVGLQKYQDAYPLMEASMRAGAASPETKAAFKAAYIVEKGSTDGYDRLSEEIVNNLKEKVKAELSKKMVNIPAFNFQVTDLRGRTVSLSDFKGKVVVLDFWATWCGPCKASFPFMQSAVNKFQNDKDVVFLFIHTWETNATPTKDAAAYIKDKKYSFNILIDAKDPLTKANNAAAGYELKGIPAKFVIDKSGVIRFSFVGGTTEGKDAFLEEITAMIELTKRAAS